MTERWYLQTKKADFIEIGRKFHISPIVARIIRNRDIVTDEQIEQYLNSDINKLSSPWLFKDMDKAVDLLQIKISQQNKIRIISDYDVDGICSGYILLKALSDIGALIDIVVPHRIEDGYGINESIIQKAYEDGVDTILTCDNGIAAFDAIAYAKSLGITVIVTDHHEVPFEEKDGEVEYILPPADAIINHKQSDCAYPFKELCGAMVAYQLISAIYEVAGFKGESLKDLLVYAAIATVCDVVDLTGENRTVVSYGLQRIKYIKDLGINTLITECNLKKDSLSSYHFGFVIGPCLNASGRLSTAKKAIDLLISNDPDKAQLLAKEIKELNDERKSMTEHYKKLALQYAADCKDNVLVIYLPECHESIIGIVAGKVKEEFHKPVIVLSDSAECVKGSGRSIEEYDMFKELSNIKHLFLKFGGHKMAAGLSIKKENIEKLRELLNINCNLTEEDLYLKVWIDVQLPLKYVTMNLISELDCIQPCGKGNSKPVFAIKNLRIIRMDIKGETGNVIRMTVEDEEQMRMTAIMFGRTQEFMEFLTNKFGLEEVNLALEGQINSIQFMATFYPKFNEFRGNTELQIVIDRFC